jgi:hypothetical protein
MLKGVVPEQIENIFDEVVGTDGFALHDLAILASTVTYLVVSDQQAILRQVCEVMDWPTIGTMDAKDMREMILMYKAVFLVGGGSNPFKIGNFTSSAAVALLQHAPESYPGWEDTVLFIDDEIDTFAFNTRHVQNPFVARESSLQVASHIVERTADHFARRVAEMECQEIKDDLLAFEIGNSGRIRLADFYRASLKARFFYTETKEYLKAVGALDDSDALMGPKVITTNYVLAKSNCLAHSHFYSICCLNECEELYGRLEQTVASAVTSPARIASLVSEMSSSSVQAPRNLSTSLLLRLQEIALAHSGDVHVHSRLFAHWMHQACPRECPYPHMSGTTTMARPMQWQQLSGVQFRIDSSPGVARSLALRTAITALEAEYAPPEEGSDTSDDDLMWTPDEETFVVPARSLSSRIVSWVSHVAAMVCFLVVVGAALFKITQLGSKTGSVCV